MLLLAEGGHLSAPRHALSSNSARRQSTASRLCNPLPPRCLPPSQFFASPPSSERPKWAQDNHPYPYRRPDLQIEPLDDDLLKWAAKGLKTTIRVQGSKSVTYQGYPYWWYYGTVAKCYRCSAYRQTGCRVKLYVSQLGVVVQGTLKHACVPEICQLTGPMPNFVDLKQQIPLATDKTGIEDVTLTPRQVSQIIREQFYGNNSVIVQDATKKQSLSRLYRTRVNHFSREIYGHFKPEPLCDVKHSSRLKFFQFHFPYYGDGVLHRAIGWVHPQRQDCHESAPVLTHHRRNLQPRPCSVINWSSS
jgi:hypothetical protein